MRILNSVALAVALASPVATMAQTSGSSAASPGGATTATTDQPALNRDPAMKAERDRPQGGSTAGANGRQDPTIKLSTGKSDSAQQGSTSTVGHQGKPNQGGTTAGANGAQDPTIKASERVYDKNKSDSSAPRPEPK